MKSCILLACILLLAFFIFMRVEVPTKLGERDYDSYVTKLQGDS